MGVNDAREQLEVCKDEYGKLERENVELRGKLAKAIDLAQEANDDCRWWEAQVVELQAVLAGLDAWGRDFFGSVRWEDGIDMESESGVTPSAILSTTGTEALTIGNRHDGRRDANLYRAESR